MSTTAAPAVRSFAPADLAYVAVFAALIAALALTPAIPIGTLGVPITLQTLGVALAGLCLGAWRGAAAVALYLMVGLAGLPVFSGGRAGLAVLVGPTGGYLIGFVISAWMIGYAMERGLGRWGEGAGRGVVGRGVERRLEAGEQLGLGGRGGQRGDDAEGRAQVAIAPP